MKVAVDSRLEDLIKGWNPQDKQDLVNRIASMAKNYKKKKLTLLGFYKYLDQLCLPVAKTSSCGSVEDCSGCCRQNVNLSKDEFKLLGLKKDSSVVPMENKERKAKRIACSMLKDTKCSVYEKRPIACRMYFTQSSPDLCSNFEMDVVSNMEMLIAVSTWRTYRRDRELRTIEEWQKRSQP